MKSPVLLLMFNRPESTGRVFERIREARPPRLYLASDGPRSEKVGETQIVKDLRADILAGIDWPCEIKSLFREENLGCARAVSGAITWFFENEEEGIILEDDTLPDPTFFRFCDELLERYRFDERIGMISGDNFQRGRVRGEGSYYFSKFSHIWGWASWRRVWKNYDLALNDWSHRRQSSFLMEMSDGDRGFVRVWSDNFDMVYGREIDTWDYSLQYCLWKNQLLAIVPQKNLASNIGFGPTATHTKEEADPNANLSTAAMGWPLLHPSRVERNIEADLFVQKVAFRPTFARRLRWHLNKWKNQILGRGS